MVTTISALGHRRRKATLLVHTVPAFLCLQRVCDSSRRHEPWAFARSMAELGYFWALAREMAALLRQQVLDLEPFRAS